jgi:hypothetical protein
VNPEIPHPCNRCEYSRVQDIQLDGRWILWCTDGRKEHLGDPYCPYIQKKFYFSDIPIPCDQCENFHLKEDGFLTFIPECAVNRPGYWGSSVCPYVKKTQ